MSKYVIKELGESQKHPNTECEYDNEVTEELLENKLSKISKIYQNEGNRSCYIVGMGAIPKSVYKTLEEWEGIEVIYYKSVLPAFLLLLSPLVASYGGLVQVNDPNKLSATFLKVVERSMAGIYIFDKSYDKSFVERVTRDLLSKNLDYSIKDDKSYFYYVVDADNTESTTGMYEIISYGKSAVLPKTYF